MYSITLKNGLKIQVKDKEMQTIIKMLKINGIEFIRMTHKSLSERKA